MTGTDRCPTCGADRPDGAPAGLCPRCLLRGVLDAEADDPASVVATTPGVLDTLSLAGGPMPRVLLRDTEPLGGPGPVVRPSSAEMSGPTDRAGRLQLLGEIARGGMGAVLKGRDNDLGRDLAVKVLLERHGENPDLVRRFVEEAQIAGQLQHPGVVPIYELGTFADRRPYFAMKLVKGRTLAELLADRSDPASDRPRLLDIFRDVAQTMAYAHARGVIHRDLKPSNVMVGSFGEVQVMDWGLAKVLARGGVTDDQRAGRREEHQTVIATARSGDSESDLSMTGSVMGTPSYMAPEQARGDGVDERCDVFALGSILCEVLTGSPAFAGRTSGEIQRKAARGETADALARLRACGADADLLALAIDCLAAEPEDRPRDAGEVSRRMTGYLAGVQDRLRAAELEAVEARAHAEEETKQRRLTVALAASVLCIVGLVAGGWAWSASRRALREAATGREVNLALAEAADLRGRSRATTAGDPALLELALAQARRGSSLLEQGEGGAELRSRVGTTLATLARELKEARERVASAEQDRRMTERLELIHADLSNNLDRTKADVGYEQAFREFGVDVASLDPAEAGARIASRTNAEALVGGIDRWIFSRRQLQGDGADSPDVRRLIAVANAADPDPWRKELRDALGRDDRDAFRRLAATVDVDRTPKESLSRIAYAMRHSLGDVEGSIRLMRAALRRNRDDFWVNYDLIDSLMMATPPRKEEALRYATAAAAIQPRSYISLANLGFLLAMQGNYEEAIVAYREVVRLKPDDLPAQYEILSLLRQSGRVDEAIAAIRQAIRLRPGEAEGYYQLSRALADLGQLDEATDAIREATRLRPGSAIYQYCLGLSFSRQGRREEAIGPLREAVRLDGDRLGAAFWALGETLCDLDRPDEAIATYRRAREIGRASPANVAAADEKIAAIRRRKAPPTPADDPIAANREAVRLDPSSALAQYHLGLALLGQGSREEAIGPLREAVRLDGDHLGLAVWVLGDTLRVLDRPDEAADAYRLVRKARDARPADFARADREIAVAEARKAQLARLDAVLKGEDRPRDAAEALAFAAILIGRARYEASARLLAEAFAADPGLADDLGNSYRYSAACCAAMAGTGQGKDDPKPDDDARARLRARALDWLKADLALHASAIGSGEPAKVHAARERLGAWKADGKLAGVRDVESQASFPEAERKGWRALWAEVNALMTRANAGKERP